MTTGIAQPLEQQWGALVRDCRIRRGLTQKTFADKIGVSQSYVSFIESGDRTPSDGLKWRIAQALGTRPEKLFPWPKAARAS